MYATTARRRNDNSMTIRQVDDTGLPAEDRTEVRMNIEDVSYEELLELGEQIGNVNNSLSEEIIINQLKTKIYLLPVNSASLEETNPCVICQEEFKDKEEIGILGCGHQYHSDCLKKWLLVKNVCPMCKSEGIHLE
ncbi:hypothetical protein VNO77_37497 [Canavalia gladiata]|uniref:RING-type E3 ubiquitin transferase n=1 Tax=Canavalia gladiata TaxID=3824 RepID=A0AAN9K8X2_CANGL